MEERRTNPTWWARVKNFAFDVTNESGSGDEWEVASRKEEEDDFPTLTLESSDDANNTDTSVEEDAIPDDGRRRQW